MNIGKGGERRSFLTIEPMQRPNVTELRTAEKDARFGRFVSASPPDQSGSAYITPREGTKVDCGNSALYGNMKRSSHNDYK